MASNPVTPTLTATEVRVVARFGFKARLGVVVDTARAYQAARVNLGTISDQLAEAAEAAEAAEELVDEIAQETTIGDGAQKQLRHYQRAHDQAKRALEEKAQAFFAVAGDGDGVQEILAAMEQHDFKITISDLRTHLESCAA